MTRHVSGDPLSSDQLDAMTEASATMSPLHRLIIHIVPYTGFSQSEFYHLRREWFEYHNDDESRGLIREVEEPDWVVIRIPPETSCTGTLQLSPGKRKDEFTERTEPCHLCEPDNVWTPEGESRVRTIPIREETPINAFTWWFQQHDSIPFSHTALPYRYINEVADEAGISRDIGFIDLRWTFAARLISTGVGSEDVAEIMGMGEDSRSRLQPLYDAVDEPIDWNSNPNFIPDGELIDEIRKVADELGYPPRLGELDEYGDYSSTTYVERFGGIEQALDAAGFDPDGDPRTEELINELQRLHDEHGRTPRVRDINQGCFSYTPYSERFGGLNEALEAAGIEPPEGDIRSEELIQELRRLSDEVEGRPRREDMQEHGEYSYATYYRRYGSWQDALDAAGLTEGERDQTEP